MRVLTLKEIQQISLEILVDVHTFCEEHRIMYSLAYGTLIGAFRHKGFIPWDDDIDVIMPRPDYERFLATYQSPRYKLLSSADKDCYVCFSRVYDDRETAIRTTFPFARHYTGGLWIDIFPADGVEDDFEAYRNRFETQTGLWKRQYYLRDPKSSFLACRSLRKVCSLLYRKITRLNGLGISSVIERMSQNASAIGFGTTGHWSQLACPDDGLESYQLAEDFQTTIPVEFEGHTFQAMNGYDRVLRKIYGDYMQLPPEDKRVPQQSAILTFYAKNK